MRRWWWLLLLLFVAAAGLAILDLRYGVTLLFVGVLVGCVVAPAVGAPGSTRLRPTVDDDGVTWSDRRGRVVESARWEDVERVRAWTRVLWWGNGSASYQQHLDVVTGPDDRLLRTRHRRRSRPSLDELLARMREHGVPVEDARRFGMLESVRRGV